MGTYDAWIKKNRHTAKYWKPEEQAKASDLVSFWGVVKLPDGEEVLAVRAHTGEIWDAMPEIRDQDVSWGTIENVVLDWAPRLRIEVNVPDAMSETFYEEVSREYDRIRQSVLEAIEKAMTSPEEKNDVSGKQTTQG